jgi:transcriptional regulator with PAS, ATPase and Fis domain
VIREKIRLIEKAAMTDKSVLILGETGTGKDLAAARIHELSQRRNKPFVAVNCANIPDDLFEAELFGFLRGAFTGAVKEKPGLFEAAEDGTIFLDEIGELPLHLQAKILRLIDKREARRVGDIKSRKIRARFIFATNKDLLEDVMTGKFRKDLYYRICVFQFTVPPLRERKEDIPCLIDYIIERENRQALANKSISPEAILKLMAYDFPGNIRELENIIERAHILSDGDIILEKDVQMDLSPFGWAGKVNMSAEKLRETLENCKWNKTRAASEIGKSRRHFYRLLEKYQLNDCVRKASLI